VGFLLKLGDRILYIAYIKLFFEKIEGLCGVEELSLY